MFNYNFYILIENIQTYHHFPKGFGAFPKRFPVLCCGGPPIGGPCGLLPGGPCPGGGPRYCG